MRTREQMEEQRRALETLMDIPATVISVSDAAKALGCDRHTLQRQIKADPSALGFPVIRIGARYSIPRVAFLRYLGMGGSSE